MQDVRLAISQLYVYQAGDHVSTATVLADKNTFVSIIWQIKSKPLSINKTSQRCKRSYRLQEPISRNWSARSRYSGLGLATWRWTIVGSELSLTSRATLKR